MRTLLTALLLLSAYASIADAQRGRRTRGEPDANWNDMDRFSRSASPLTVKDVENMSAVKLLVDERKKLRLSDDQNNQLKSMVAQEKETNKDALQAVDSLRKIARARPTAMTPEEETRMTIARAELRTVIDTVFARYRATADQALALLDDTQKAAATELLEKQRDENRQTLRAKFAEMSQAARPGSAGGRP